MCIFDWPSVNFYVRSVRQGITTDRLIARLLATVRGSLPPTAELDTWRLLGQMSDDGRHLTSTIEQKSLCFKR